MTSDAERGDVLIDQGVRCGLGKRADVYRPRRNGPAASDGWRPTAVVCLAGGFHQAAPLSPDGRSPIDAVAVTRAEPVPFRLVHGTRDNVLAVTESRDFAAVAGLLSADAIAESAGR